MSDPVVLVVVRDPDQVQRIAAALQRVMAPRPVLLQSGEAAARWVGVHHCDVCVLDYQLPDMDGLEALSRIQQRKPDLPVIMVSAAKSEQVAVSAFRAGVADFVPKQPGFEAEVARRVNELVGRRPLEPVMSPPSHLAGVPPALLQLTYQNRLRVIGRQLDLQGYHSINLVEVVGGILVRALPPGSRMPEALEFPDDHFPHLLQSAIAARGAGERTRNAGALLPTGYEDFLRALGYRFDQRLAEAITVTELGTIVAVGGIERADGYEKSVVVPFQELMRDDDIVYLLDEAYRRRRAAPSPTLATRLGNVLGRR